MNKYDWLELFTRALGVWLVAQGALGVLGAIGIGMAMSGVAVDIAGSSVTDAMGSALLISLGTSFLGSVMILLAPGFVGWLREKDASAIPSRGHEATAGEGS